MSELIKSVLNYSRLVKDETEATVVDLNEIISNIKIDFELLLDEKAAVITSGILRSSSVAMRCS